MKRFRDQSTFTKLIIAFSLMQLLLVAMGIIAIRSINQIHNRAETLYQDHLLSYDRLYDLRTQSLKMHTAVAWHILTYGTAAMDKQEEVIAQIDETLQRLVATYENDSLSDVEREVSAKLAGQLKTFHNTRKKILHLSRLYSKDASAELQREQGAQELVTLTNSIQQLIEIKKDHALEQYKASTKLAAQLTHIALGLMLGGLGCGLLLGWSISRSISKGLTNILQAAESIGDGNLGTRSSIDTQDDIGLLAKSFNKMADKIAASIEEVIESKHAMEAIDKTYAVVEFSLDGTILDANEHFLSLTGYDKGEVVGQHHRLLCDQAYGESDDFTAFWEKLRRGEFAAGTFHRVTKHGKGIWIQASYKPIVNTSGKPYKVIKLATDVTAQKESEIARHEQEARLHAIVTHAVDGIVTINERGIIESFNAAAERMFGYTAAEAIGQNVKILMPEPYQSEHDGYLENYRASGQRKIIGIGREVTGLRKNGSTFPLELAVSELHLQGGRLFTGILRDITERAAAATQLEQATIQMECINLELEMANEEVRQATEAKSAFLASMSHEIRTPMNSIVGMAQLLGETPLTPEQQDYTQRLRRASDHLLDLINDILDLSKIESGHLELETILIDLRNLMENVGEMMALRAHAKQIDYVVRVCPGLPEKVSGDPTRLRQILVNLVGNAIKFTETGQILVQVELAESGQFQFSVSDTGIGIPAEKLGSIFDSFSQADSSTTRKYGGTGLGLSICKRLVELMDGDISVTSTPGIGSTFVFTVPLPTVSLETLTAGPDLLALKGKRILIVDDHQPTRLVIREILSEAGAIVSEANSGPLAVAHLQTARADNQPVQLMIVDRRMPDMDGLELVKTVRAMPTEKDLPVLLLISYTEPSDRTLIQDLGITHQIIKPVSRAGLLVTARDTIMRQSALATLHVEQAPSQAGTNLRPLRILLVDDLEDNRDLVILFLKNLPYSVETAVNGREAVEKVQATSYDIVLMDVQMPIMDGLEATATIRQWERAEGRIPIPIIALTAQALTEEREKSLAAGYTAHLTKPIKKPDLLKAIEGYTGLAQDQAA